MDQPMAVDTRQLVQQPETFALSVVRLYRFEQDPVLVGELLDPVLLSEQIRLTEDRELDGLWFERWERWRVEQGNLVRHVVKRGLDAVEVGAEESGEAIESFSLGGWIDESAKDRCPFPALHLYPDSVRVRFHERSDLVCKGLSVSIRPAKARVAIGQGVESHPLAETNPAKSEPERGE